MVAFERRPVVKNQTSLLASDLTKIRSKNCGVMTVGADLEVAMCLAICLGYNVLEPVFVT